MFCNCCRRNPLPLGRYQASNLRAIRSSGYGEVAVGPRGSRKLTLKFRDIRFRNNKIDQAAIDAPSLYLFDCISRKTVTKKRQGPRDNPRDDCYLFEIHLLRPQKCKTIMQGSGVAIRPPTESASFQLVSLISKPCGDTAEVACFPQYCSIIWTEVSMFQATSNTPMPLRKAVPA